MQIIKMLLGDTLPKAQLFNISEIAGLLDIGQDELLLWESQFPQLRSRKLANCTRMYDQHALLLFSAIKQLLVDKGQPIALVQKTLAETDAEAMKPFSTHDVASDLLQEAYRLLPVEEVAFDEITNEIYQELKHCIDQVAAGEMSVEISPGNIEETKRNKYKEYQERLAILLAQKESLNEILTGLDKYIEPAILRDLKY